MKLFLIVTTLTQISLTALGQTCGCAQEKFLIECDTSYLQSNALIYYQFNCDSIWLTLENKNAEKFIIYKTDMLDFYGPSTLHLKQDCTESALFSIRYTKTDIDFFVINKSNGKVIRTFQNVIDVERNQTCFVAYYNSSKENISVYNIETEIEVEIKSPLEIMKGDFTCTGSNVIENSLFLYFYNTEFGTKTIEVDINSKIDAK